MKFAYITDIGKRSSNQDSLYVPDSDNLPLFIVADGMGGHNAGSIASELAVKSVAEYVFQSTDTQLPLMVKTAAAYANAKVYAQSQSDTSLDGMGTTLAFVYIDGNTFISLNIGDSRVYHFDGISLFRVTQDHSYVAELVNSGNLSEENAKNHPNRNLITRAIGIKPSERADIFENSWHFSDIILLCTDGLYRGVTDSVIKETLKNVPDLDDACEYLLDLARRGGSTDNITIIIIKHEG